MANRSDVKGLLSPRRILFLISLIGIALLLAAILLAGRGVRAANPASGSPAQGSSQSSDTVWQFIEESSIASRGPRQIIPQTYRTVSVNETALRQLLNTAPKEFSQAAKQSVVILTLPMPDGTFSMFRIEDSPIMEASLAAQYPEIKTYRGQGIDEPTATTRFDLTPAGFHAIIFSERGTVYIDPYAKGDTTNYLTYYKRDYRKDGDEFRCYFTDDDAPQRPDGGAAPAVVNGSVLRTYRLACAATGEYTAFHGGTVAAGLAAINTAMNRVNGVYEREIAVRMVLVANNNLIVYTNAATDPYTNNSGSTMLGQNQSNLDSVIGTANYDIGHVFSTGGGGVASLGSVCSSTRKAQGVTGLPSPIGDGFTIDYVAHEMGHQFGGRHTFNGTTSNCGGGNRSSVAAYEPGSGSTIMAYAGICGSQNLQPNSDDYFHVKSLEEMVAFINGGGSCAVNTNTGNTVPSVTAAASFTIPRSTPFALTANGSDANGDALTYCWEEYDLGAASPPDTDTDGQARPILRSFNPTTNATRTFPKLSDILNNTSSFGEALPTINRTMTFQVTVRDNRANGGGISTATTQVTVNAASGPFLVTQPNTAITWQGNSSQTVTWDVANTAAPPVSAANVKISLSTDGGTTFPVTIAASTANDGSETITVPNTPTTTARIKVEAVGNIFFDLSNQNFTITAGGGCTYSINPTSQNFAAAGGNGSVNVTAGAGCNWTAVSNAAWITINSGGNGTGNGTVNYSVAANSTQSQRQGTMTIAGQTFTVTQDGATGNCNYSIAPTSRTVSSSGGIGTVTVTTTAGCNWTAASNDGWITVTSGASGTGNGTVAFSVSANQSSNQRQGTITIAGLTFTVTQAGTGCVNSASPDSASFDINGGSAQFRVNAPGNCNWVVTNVPSWVTITSNPSGSGTKKVNYDVAPNTGNARRADLVIGGQVHSIEQAGSGGVTCTYAINPTSQNFIAGGGTGSVNVTAGATCAWTATSNAAWITITFGSNGTGNGTVTFLVDANQSTSQRQGTMTIAGQTFTVTQAGETPTCAYAINPTSQSFTSGGGNGTVAVTADAGCNWAAASNDAWITITSGASGTGNGTVTFSVDANQSTSQRQGTMTIAGLTFTVTQSGATPTCSYSISPTSKNVSSGQVTGSVQVFATAGCSWTAGSNVNWITIASGASGTGNGIVLYTVSANNSRNPRTGTLTVAGQTFTVVQAGRP